MKIVEELSKSIEIQTINKLQLVNLVSVACSVKNTLSDIRVTNYIYILKIDLIKVVLFNIYYQRIFPNLHVSVSPWKVRSVQ